MWQRLKALIVKELLAVFRDPRGRIALIGPPLIQLFVLSYAATLDVSNFDIGIRNQDAGYWSAEFIQRVAMNINEAAQKQQQAEVSDIDPGRIRSTAKKTGDGEK